MNWKNLSLIVGIYLIIFALIFYLLLPSDSDEIEHDVDSTEAFNQLFSNIKTSFSNSFSNMKSSFNFFSNIRLSRYFLPSSCNFRQDFSCEYFSYDFDKKEIILEVKSNMERFVFVMDIEITGEINCYTQTNVSLRRNDFFFVKLDDCIFNGTDSRILLRYHEGNPTFYRVVEGRFRAK